MIVKISSRMTEASEEVEVHLNGILLGTALSLEASGMP